MKLHLTTVLLIVISLPGCDELYDDGSRPKSAVISSSSNNDLPQVNEYIAHANLSREEEYKKLKKPRARELFSQQADQLDMQNIRDLRSRSLSNFPVNADFGGNPYSGDIRPRDRQYTPMDFKPGAYGDSYRLGQAGQDAGNAMMQASIRRYEEDAREEARNAFYSYAMKMDRVKLAQFYPNVNLK